MEEGILKHALNRNSADIHRSYDTSRQTAREELAAAGGHGSTALVGAYGQIAEAEGRDVGNMSATLRSQGYSDAVANAMGLYSGDRSGNIARAGAYGNIASGAQGVDQYGRAITANDQDRKLFAGDRIQGQNQAELDAYYRERDRELGYPYQQSDFLRGVLGAYPTGSTQNSTTPGVGAVPGAIGGGLLGYKVGQQYVPTISGLPWTSPQYTNPSTGMPYGS